jgi:DNA uptake protein ComE-like DNA-binding protein
VVIAALVVLASFVVVTSNTSAASADGSQSPAIDLAHPTATVNDPAAALAPVNTSCASGQVDINNASVADLSAALGIHSRPTVSRLVAMRPWLKGTDLSSVPGIGPSLAAQLAPKTCATQPDPTLRQPRACSTSAEVDLNTASATTIQSRLGLPAVTVTALIGARPLPQNLSQVIAPRVPGLSQPKVDALTKQGLICVTPAPYMSGVTLYRWITANGGAVIRNGSFALIVPPGRTIGTGAYGGVTPLDPDDGVLPKANYHIFGAWNSGITTVAVQGPQAVPDQPGRDVVFHEAGDGDRMSLGDGVATSTVNGVATVTATATSLSAFVYGYTPCALSDYQSFGGNPACLDGLTDGSVRQAWLANAAAQGGAAQKSLIEQTHCGDVGTGHVVSGSLPYGMSCNQQVTDSNSGQVTWSMTNKASVNVAYGLASGEVVYNYSTEGSQYTDPPALDGGDDANLINRLIIDGVSAPLRWIFAGQTLHVAKQRGFLDTTVNVNANPIATATWNGFNQLLGAIPDVNSSKVIKVALDAIGKTDTLKGCIPNHLNDPGDALGCLKGVLGDVIDYLKTPANLEHALSVAGLSLTSAKKTALVGTFATATKFLKWFAVADWAGSFLASVAFQHIGGTGVVLANEPPAWSVDDKGRPALSHCLSHNWTSWTLDEVCQDLAYGDYTPPVVTPPDPQTPPENAFDDWDGSIHSWRLYNVLERDAGGTLYLVLLENGKLVAHPIAKRDEAAFKEDWPEHEWVSNEFPTLIDEIGPSAVNDPLHLRDFTKGRGGNWLLRQSDGTAWWIDGNGVRHWVDTVQAQEDKSRTVLTLDPAQWASDVCPYPAPGETDLRAC